MPDFDVKAVAYKHKHLWSYLSDHSAQYDIPVSDFFTTNDRAFNDDTAEDLVARRGNLTNYVMRIDGLRWRRVLYSVEPYELFVKVGKDRMPVAGTLLHALRCIPRLHNLCTDQETAKSLYEALPLQVWNARKLASTMQAIEANPAMYENVMYDAGYVADETTAEVYLPKRISRELSIRRIK